MPLLAALTLMAPPATARTEAVPTAALTEVTGFGTNPSNLQMYVYVPAAVTAHPAIVVAVHYCGGSGPAMYSGTEYASLADQLGFIVVYPSVTRASKCFDVSSPQALHRDGGSDPVGIKSMVDWVTSTYSADTSRVFALGISSGAMMTNVLLGDYPDVFAAGAAFMRRTVRLLRHHRRLRVEHGLRERHGHPNPAAMGRLGPGRRPRLHRPAPSHAVVARHRGRHAALPQLRRGDQTVDQRAGRQPDPGRHRHPGDRLDPHPLRRHR